MSYQVSATDPIVSVSAQAAEVNVATKLKAAGIVSQAGLNTVISNINTTNCPGMSNAACQALQALLALFQLTP